MMSSVTDELIFNIVKDLKLECYEKNYTAVNGDKINIRVVEISNLPSDQYLSDLVYDSLEKSNHQDRFKKVRLIHGKIICTYKRRFESKYVSGSISSNDKEFLFVSCGNKDEEEFVKFDTPPLFFNLEIMNLRLRMKKNHKSNNE